MPPDLSSANPGHLSHLIADLEAAGVRPTPLGVIARATDLGMSDAEIGAIVDELANGHGLEQVKA